MPESHALDPQATESSIRQLFARLAWLAIGTGLVAVVALTSRSGGVDVGGDVAMLSPLQVVEVVGYVALFAGAVIVPLAFWLGRHQRQRLRAARSKTRRSGELSIPRWASALGLLVVILVMVGQVAVVVAFLADLQRARSEQAEPPAAPGAADAPGGLADGRGLESLTIALVITLVLAAIAVAVLIAWRREGGSPDGARGVARRSAAEAAVDIGLDALRAEPDPRRAVIRAYGAMGQSLSRSGFPRAESEAPLEYLRRVFAGFAGVAHDVSTITNLFQLAKFSHHEVDDTMRGTAIAALERLRTRTDGRP